MTSEFETILLQEAPDPDVKLEPSYEGDDEPNENSRYTNRSTPIEASKMEFSLFPLFTAHVEQHLKEMYPAKSLDTATGFVTVDLKPPVQLNSDSELPVEHPPLYSRKKPKVKRVNLRKCGKRPIDDEISAESLTKARVGQLADQPLANSADATVCCIKTMQKNEANVEIYNRDPYQASICTICNLEFKNKWSFVWHRRHVHKLNCQSAKRSFECYLCRAQFNGPRKLSIHNRQQHLSKLQYRDYRYRLHKCKQCDEEFNDIELMAKHRRWHKEQLYGRPHKCDVCGRGFIEGFQLRRHTLLHTTTRAFKCDICGHTFKTAGAKLGHMRSHTGENRVQCAECGKLLGDAQKLKRHMLTHSNESPFECEYCHKRFRQHYSMVIHKRSHTGEYIHYCKPCERGFGMRRELRKHNLRIHGIEAGEENGVK